MSYSPPARPVLGPNEFSVWADDRIEAKNRKTTLPVWLCEFAGSREDCLRYLDGVLINLETGNVLWGFAVYPPGTSPENVPPKPLTRYELLVNMFGENWEEATTTFSKKK